MWPIVVSSGTARVFLWHYVVPLVWFFRVARVFWCGPLCGQLEALVDWPLLLVGSPKQNRNISSIY